MSGKHYVISDLHGRNDIYEAARDLLEQDDTLYILGDVIDRGPDGVKILEDIINRQNDPNGPKIVFLMGNHEMQFLECVKIFLHFPQGCKREDIIEALVIANLKEKQRDYQKGSKEFEDYENTIKEHLEKCKDIFDNYKTMYPGVADLEILKMMYNHFEILNVWLYYNGGTKTLRTLFNKEGVLDLNSIGKMFDFLQESNLAIVEQIGEEKFLLVHAFPPQSQLILGYIINSQQVKYNDNVIPKRIKEGMLQNREKDGWNYQAAINEGLTTICGHTSSDDGGIKVHEENGKKVCFNIDTGCYKEEKPDGKPRAAALFCLEDKKVQYITGREEINYTPQGTGESITK